MMDFLIDDDYAQISAELLLLLSGIIVIVLVAIHIYQQYINDLGSDIQNNQIKDLINQIDSLNGYL